MRAEPKSEPICQQCGKPLFGRTDKRFCNDGCRNSFNREKAAANKAKHHENLPEIFKIIKHNYEILKSYELEKLDEKTCLVVPEQEMKNRGFNPKFFTSTYTDTSNWHYQFCFEFGYRFAGGSYELCYRPEQARINRKN